MFVSVSGRYPLTTPDSVEKRRNRSARRHLIRALF
jgi:hypothetical protein